MASNKLDHPDLAHSSIKIEGLAGERLGPGYTRELSQEMIHRNGLQLQDRHVPEPMVKLEKGTSPDEVESKSLRTRISVTESRPFPGEENIGSFKMLEKGLIYFFYRSRVDIISAGGISDVARSFIVLRPTPSEATAGTMELGRKFRLLVVPKKIFPTSGRIKEIAFVEKAGITLKELQNIFLTGGEYETQAYGTRTIADATLFAKGVYTITSVQRSSYLSYILTNPQALGPVQEDFGLRLRGSWLVQSKNPKLSSPASVRFPKSPEYPESFGEIFGFYRWVPLKPELIDYSNAQILLIGRSHRAVSSVVPEGKREDRIRADEELEEIARMNDERENNLRGVDPVYGDLGLQVLHVPRISTAWAH